jgi:hypothetical protein
MIEMRNTLTTWPQLATAVTLGGALTADTCRRIFLDQFTDSGRYFIDLENLVPDVRAKNIFEPKPIEETSDKTMKELAQVAGKDLAVAQYTPAKEEISELVSAAILAPSAGNSQPWKWYYSAGYLFLFYNDTGIISFGDFEHIAAHVAHGAAIENIALAAYARKIKAEVKLFPVAGERRLVAAIGFTATEDATLFEPERLIPNIQKRRTNRDKSQGGAIDARILHELQRAAASVDGANLIFKTAADEIKAVADIVGPAERLKLLNPATHYEFYDKEICWDDRVSDSNEGITVSSLSISQPEEILLKMARNPAVPRLLNEWKGGQALEITGRFSTNSAAAIGLLTMPGRSSQDYVNGGRAVERMWLKATDNMLALQPLMTPLLFFARLKHGAAQDMPDLMKHELEQLYSKFTSIFPLRDGEHMFLFKLSISKNLIARTPRKPLERVLLFSENAG